MAEDSESELYDTPLDKDEYPPVVNNFAHLTDLSGGWLPKTDWSRDGIIANDD